jgi:exopolysaccharide production protein ExoY
MPSRPLRAPLPPAEGDVGDEDSATAAPATRVVTRSATRARALGAAPALAPVLTPALVVSEPPRALTGRKQRRAAARASLALTPAVDAPAPVAAWRLAIKRALDVAGALAGLLLAAPLLAVLAVAVKLASPGPVLFGQLRIGQGGRRFTCYKLRTMCADAETRLAADDDLRASYEANHFKLPARHDPRVTALGRFLRVTSLDELPQFWNVLRGDMSLVGPRPIVEAELEHYGTSRDVLLAVKPGLTGAWAVQGRSRIGYPMRARIELEYARGWTLRGDLGILVRTVGVVLQRRGAY